MNATARMAPPQAADSGQPAPAPAAPKRGLGGSAVRVGVIGLAVGLGAFAGSFAATPWLAPAPAPRPEAEKPADEEKPSAPPASASQRLVDELIEEGRFAPALDACRAAASPNDPLPPAMTYRLALCLEGLGRPAEAAAAFRECVSRGTSEPLRAAARFGLARAALRQGHLDEGRELLCATLLRSAQPALRARPYAGEALVLLALSLAEEFQPGEAPSATRPAALARPVVVPGVEVYAGWDVAPRLSAAKEWAPTGILKVARPESAAGGPRVDASLPAGPLVERVERLAEAAGLRADWGPGARDALLGRSGELACAGSPLADVLTWLTLPFGLTAEVEGKAVKIRQVAKLPAAEARRARGELAKATLRAALLPATNHPHAGYLYLALGNLEAGAGRTVEAFGWYERLLRDRPRSPAVMEAMYNLGLLRLREGDVPLARQAFYEALDRAPGHDMTALCYWWIARTHLDDADTAGARRALFRCAQAGAGAAGKPGRGKDDTAAAAALGLACAYLFDGQPRQAWEALNGVRPALQEPPFLAPATLLDGMARYELAGDDTKKREAVLTGLVAVALAPREAPWLGPILPYLRGKALRQLGLGQEMLALYEQQLRTSRGKLAGKMELEVADALQSAGRDALARARLERLLSAAGKAGNRELQAAATLHLAALDLRANQPDACLSRCRALLQDRPAERAAILALMSRAYTSKKDYARAASCLANEVPEP